MGELFLLLYLATFSVFAPFSSSILLPIVSARGFIRTSLLSPPFAKKGTLQPPPPSSPPPATFLLLRPLRQAAEAMNYSCVSACVRACVCMCECTKMAAGWKRRICGAPRGKEEGGGGEGALFFFCSLQHSRPSSAPSPSIFLGGGGEGEIITDVM